jgi:hypothetical protein
MAVVVGDPTKVFLARQAPSWYERQSLRIETLRPIELAAITVNPVAPRSHRFDSEQLRELLREAIEGVPIFDVLGSGYAEAAAPPLAK